MKYKLNRGILSRLFAIAAQLALLALCAGSLCADGLAAPLALPALVEPRSPDGSGSVAISGDLMEWHKVTLTLDGPFANERDNEPNPFTDQNLQVTFSHESGAPVYKVPGYFAADGNAAATSAGAGTKWRAHFAPDKVGTWNYRVSFTRGKHAALDGGGAALRPFDGQAGSFVIAKTDKSGRDFRAKGRLQYDGKHHLQFAGSKEYFLKAGADAPETLLGYPSITVNGEGNASVRDERWYLIHYKEGTEEFYDMERDPMQWTNLVTSKDPEIIIQKSRLAASFPASFAPTVFGPKKSKGDKEEKDGEPDPTIKTKRAAANLK